MQLGRLLGGIATSLLFSAFESWLVAEHFKGGFDGAWLGDTFSKVSARHSVTLTNANGRPNNIHLLHTPNVQGLITSSAHINLHKSVHKVERVPMQKPALCQHTLPRTNVLDMHTALTLDIAAQYKISPSVL